MANCGILSLLFSTVFFSSNNCRITNALIINVFFFDRRYWLYEFLPYTNESLKVLKNSVQRVAMNMRVFLLKDVERIGLEGEVIKVSRGYAQNFLIPRGFAAEITPANEAQFRSRVREVKNRQEVIASKTSMLAEKIGAIKLVLKRKVHDDNKLYGSVSAAEIADLLALEGIRVAKNQIVLDKSIKEIGSYDVTVKLSSKLLPKFNLKIVAAVAEH